MHRTILAVSAALALLSAPALPAIAQTRGGAAPPGSMAATGPKDFIEDAAMADLAAIEMARLALTKASSANVKQYAQKMIDDHSRARQRIAPLAMSKGVQPPQALDPEHRMKIDRLTRLSGPEFDREYMQMQAEAHRRALDLYQRAGQQSIDKEVQAFARQATPAVQQRYSEATQIVASLPQAGTAAGAGRTQ